MYGSLTDIPRIDGRVAIVCGSAPCLQKEYDEAVSNIDNPFIILINEASMGVWGHCIASVHLEELYRFKLLSINKEVFTIACPAGDIREGYKADYWVGEATSGGTSTCSGVKLANLLGAEKIYIVGAPMNGGDGYFNAGYTKQAQKGTFRFGDCDAKGRKDHCVRNHQTFFIRDIKPIKDKVRSLSGWTMEFLGEPEWRHK